MFESTWFYFLFFAIAVKKVKHEDISMEEQDKEQISTRMALFLDFTNPAVYGCKKQRPAQFCQKYTKKKPVYNFKKKPNLTRPLMKTI